MKPVKPNKKSFGVGETTMNLDEDFMNVDEKFVFFSNEKKIHGKNVHWRIPCKKNNEKSVVTRKLESTRVFVIETKIDGFLMR